ncbi:hypothetical protein KSP40_PGU000846 [Platanthera guangdongensis]|uniref:Uncharacterized protein n=1 Tax=Platanthera guangdongensis TaxID=2320717 RepID=A0ABR2N0F3_9ASPA
MRNIDAALRSARISTPVTTTVSTAVLGTSYPPSQGAFTEEASQVMGPIVSFLASINAPLLANVYPYFAYAGNPVEIRLDYELFTASDVVVQDGSLASVTIHCICELTLVSERDCHQRKIEFKKLPQDVRYLTRGGVPSMEKRSAWMAEVSILRGRTEPAYSHLLVDSFIEFLLVIRSDIFGIQLSQTIPYSKVKPRSKYKDELDKLELWIHKTSKP